MAGAFAVAKAAQAASGNSHTDRENGWLKRIIGDEKATSDDARLGGASGVPIGTITGVKVAQAASRNSLTDGASSAAAGVMAGAFAVAKAAQAASDDSHPDRENSWLGSLIADAKAESGNSSVDSESSVTRGILADSKAADRTLGFEGRASGGGERVSNNLGVKLSLQGELGAHQDIANGWKPSGSIKSLQKLDNTIENILLSLGKNDLFSKWETLKGNINASFESVKDIVEDGKQSIFDSYEEINNGSKPIIENFKAQKNAFYEREYELAILEYRSQKTLQGNILPKLKSADALVRNTSREFYSHSFWPSVDFVSKLMAIASKDLNSVAQGIQMLGTLDFTNMMISLETVVSEYVELWKIMQKYDKIFASFVEAGRKALAAERKAKRYKEKLTN